MKKIHIEKNSVQETLIVPLYGRKMCAEKFSGLYKDTSAKELCESLDYDFSQQEAKKDSFAYEFGALEAAMRQIDIMYEIETYLKQHPRASVVNLGCGLDQTGKACDNGNCNIVNIDFQDTIAIREELLPLGEREKNIGIDLKDYSWMDEISYKEGVVFFAAGVFHYFKRDEVKAMVLKMADRFPKGALVFDSVGKLGLKMMLSKTLKNMEIKNVDGFFYVNKPLKDLNWSDKIKVGSRGYMLGYHNMKSPGIKARHRFLAKIGDGLLHMAVNRIDFLV